MKAYLFRYEDEVHLIYAENETQAWELITDTYDEDEAEEGTLSPLPTSDVPATFVISI